MQIYDVLSKAGLSPADALVDQLFGTEVISAVNFSAHVEHCPLSCLKDWMALQQPFPRSLFSNEARFSDRIVFGSFVAISAMCWMGVGPKNSFRLEAKEVQTGDANDSSSHAQSMCQDASTHDQVTQSPMHSLACHLDTSCLLCIQVPRVAGCCDFS